MVLRASSVREVHFMNVLARIKSQVKAAESDLQLYRPESINWYKRALMTANALIPWLLTVAPELKDYVQDVLNAPSMLRSLWSNIRPHVKVSKEPLEAFDRLLLLDEVLRESVTGEVVSKVVTKYLLEHYPASALACNSRSDYPDVYLTTQDYSVLPTRTRGTQDEYGAALRGKTKRPVRVPDGLEIKTCRNRIAVDCHYPHAGLHLVLLFNETARFFKVHDLRVAFLRAADYRESERNTEATTVKHSFNGDSFVSLLGSV